MVMRSYSEMYLYDAMCNFGEAIDYAVNACKLDGDEFLDLFIASGISDCFGKGNPRCISGLSGTELVMETVAQSGLEMEFPEAQIDYERSAEYWCGWIMAFYQWFTGRTFRDIHNHFGMNQLLKLYPILHEASEEKAVDTFERIVAQGSEPSRLQQQRKICGYSQSELAARAGVNLRTLQQYELKTKSILKASAGTVMALANALGCRIEDIVEFA